MVHRENNLERRLFMRKQMLFSIILSLMIIFSSTSIILANSLASENEPDELVGRAGARQVIYINEPWEINDEEEHVNEIIYLNDNATILSGKKLILENTTIIVNESSNSEVFFEISVNLGGTLILKANSVITNNDQTMSNYELKFNFGSNVLIEDSLIENCGHESEKGIYIQSNNVTFINSELDGNYHGIGCYGAVVTMKDCIIENSVFNAIYCNNSEVTIWDTTMQSNMLIENDSSAYLTSTQASTKVYDTSKVSIYWWLTVNVTNTTAPLEGATVEVWDSLGLLKFEGVTDANGQAKNIQCLEYEEYTDNNLTMLTPHKIRASLDGYLSNETSEEIDSDMTIILPLELKPATGTISGQVKDENEVGIENINVTVGFDSSSMWTFTDALGNYKLLDVPAGNDYTVIARGEKNNLSQYKDVINDSVNVNPDETTTVDFILIENRLPVSSQVMSWDDWIDAEDAEDVDIDTKIKISFLHSMDNTSINNNNIKLKRNVNEIPIVITPLPSEGKEFLLGPSEDLMKETEYQLVISDDVKRLHGGAPVPVFWRSYIISFTTEIEVILQRNPLPDATDVDPEGLDIYVVFHESIELNETALQDGGFRVNIGNSQVSGVPIIDPQDTQKVHYKLNNELNGLTSYNVVLSDDLVDAYGNYILRTADQWHFTTRKTTTEISGQLLDQNKKPMPGVEIILELNETDSITDTTDSNGNFSFIDLVAGTYNIIINKKGYKEITQEVSPKVNNPVTLPPLQLEKKPTDKAEEEFDPIWLVAILVIVIIIIIILALLMRKPRPAEPMEEEYYEEAAVTAAPAPTPSRARAPAPPTQMTMAREAYEPPARGVPSTTAMRSVNRCPVCAHKLMASGECFHCKMDQLYGRY